MTLCSRQRSKLFLRCEIPYSITSSARTSKPVGNVMPIASAGFKLMVSVNLVACCTGRSAGLSPFANAAGVNARRALLRTPPGRSVGVAAEPAERRTTSRARVAAVDRRAHRACLGLIGRECD